MFSSELWSLQVVTGHRCRHGGKKRLASPSDLPTWESDVIRGSEGVSTCCVNTGLESRDQTIKFSDQTPPPPPELQPAASIIKGSPQASLDIGEKTRQISSYDVR